MYKIVIFDLDGTLLDTIGDLAEAGNRTCRKFGWPERDVETYRNFVGHGMRNLIARMAGYEDITRAGDKINIDNNMIENALDDFRKFYADCYMDLTKPFFHMPEILSGLKSAGVVMGVCSNKDDQFTRDLIEKFYPGVFGAVQGGRPNVPVKPDPAAALSVLRNLKAAAGLDPAAGLKILFAGDSATDIQTGRAAGLDVCSVTWGYRPAEKLKAARPDFLVYTPEELAAVIRGEKIADGRAENGLGRTYRRPAGGVEKICNEIVTNENEICNRTVMKKRNVINL